MEINSSASKHSRSSRQYGDEIEDEDASNNRGLDETQDHEAVEDLNQEEQPELKSAESQEDDEDGEGENFDEQDDIRSTEDLLQKCMVDEGPTDSERIDSEMTNSQARHKGSESTTAEDRQ